MPLDIEETEHDITDIIERIEKTEKAFSEIKEGFKQTLIEIANLASRVSDCEDSIDALAKIG